MGSDAVNKEKSLEIAASILGPLIAAEASKTQPAEIAKRLFELATAIEEHARQQPAGKASVSPLRL
jgi:hypothetical protein